ncbi:MAG: hypothetical protein R3C11_14525 [Planctomycetaceae bacterium]
MDDQADAMTTTAAKHFVTLFDLQFLPLGLALYRSLQEYASHAELWVVCMDREVEAALSKLSLPGLHIIPLSEIETEDLLSVKPTRTRAEYCWTLTPFTMEAVFAREPNVRRVTYLDADLLFFDSPENLLSELTDSDRQILITEHAYAPEYDQTATSGRFCVQFMTFNRHAAALEVAHWWQQRCLECCSEVPIDGKFGDQKYLDEWPDLFEEDVHILKQVEKTLAPWNVGYQSVQTKGKLMPVFYHFHGFRIYAGERCRLYSGYQIPDEALSLYQHYLAELRKSFAQLTEAGVAIEYAPLSNSVIEQARRFKRKIQRTEAYRNMKDSTPF